jgi:adenylate kinase
MTPETTRFQNILVMGKSGAGKQPRIDVLVKEFGLEQLSTGDIFRHFLNLLRDFHHQFTEAEVKDIWGELLLPDPRIREILSRYSSSEEEMEELFLGVKARYYIRKGLFVPDVLVNDLVDIAFSKMGYRGAVLDGYPRTMPQARHLISMVEKAGTRIDLVLLVDNEDEAIVARVVGRRICPSCGKVFHMEYKPPKEGRTCTRCGHDVVQRIDDTEENIWSRLRQFHHKVEPILEFIEEKGIPVAVVSGDLPEFTEEAVRSSVLEAIDVIDI